MRQLFADILISSHMYGLEKVALPKHQEAKLEMLRILVAVTIRESIRNDCIRRAAQVLSFELER